MKQAAIIFNPNSGKHNKKYGKNVISFYSFIEIFKKYGYEVEIHTTQYQGHAKEIIQNLDYKDLVISVGGDGTFNETMAGNLKRTNRLVLSHLPYGTTNDIGAMFGLGKNPYNDLQAILSGKVMDIDICTINGNAFVYSAGFGKFMNISYETSRALKKRIGKFAYYYEAVKDLLRKTPLYEITYEVNGEKHHGLYSVALISNATRIAGINNFYRDIKLDDNRFEVIFSNIQTKVSFIKSLIYLKTNNLTKVPGFYFHKTNRLTIRFHDKLKKPWQIDGELLPSDTNVYDIKVVRNIKMMIPKRNLDKLFVGSYEE